MTSPWKGRGEGRSERPYDGRHRDGRPPGDRPPREDRLARSSEPRSPAASKDEMRLYGFNAIQAVFARRPQAIRKLYLSEARIPQLQTLLAWCVKHRVGYRVVEEGDLSKLAASAHHEGVVAEVLKQTPLSLGDWLQQLPAGPTLAIWLDGVGNPHNFGAILRSAAHFGVAGILLPRDSTLTLSGAAARVAEGAAEYIPLVQMGHPDHAIAQLRAADFQLAATVVRNGRDVFATQLPERLIYVMGAEGEGMVDALTTACDMQLSIPGTGRVESLNVAAATAVFLAQWRSGRA